MLSESQLQFDALLIEAQMSLATAALFKCDTNKALRLYSLVNTPQAAWNQSQVYVHISSIEYYDYTVQVGMIHTNSLWTSEGEEGCGM